MSRETEDTGIRRAQARKVVLAYFYNREASAITAGAAHVTLEHTHGLALEEVSGGIEFAVSKGWLRAIHSPFGPPAAYQITADGQLAHEQG